MYSAFNVTKNKQLPCDHNHPATNLISNWWLHEFKVPQDAKADYNYKIQVSGSGGISFRKTARNVRVTSKATSLFIQTDRPVYKPGDLGNIIIIATLMLYWRNKM
jgi:hypothetical protein